MSVMETLNTRRTYRRFAQKPVYFWIDLWIRSVVP